MTTLRNMRGYTLVEIGLVLMAALLMASALLASYYEWDHNAKIRETERSMASTKQAIVNYAAESAKRNAGFRVVNVSAATTVSYWLPAGRPYLPCPDITGDGIEDRMDEFASGVLSAGVLMSVRLGYDDNASSVPAYSRSYSEGNCYRYRGLAPWKTLGSPREDAWGNHFTYRVDPKFAYQLTGFDQETRSDDSVPYGNLTVGVDAAMQTIAIMAQVLSETAGAEDFAIPTPTGSDLVTVWGTGSPLESTPEPSIICDSAPCQKGPAVQLVAGAVATISMLAQTGGYELDAAVYANFQPGNIIDGLPVVLVSHGENGYGAVKAVGSPDAGLYCVPFPPGATSGVLEEEKQNAYSSEDADGPTGFPDCDAVLPDGVSNAEAANGFVWKDLDRVGDDEFDDIVQWMSADEIASELIKRGVFPVEKLPPLGLEDY